MTREELKQYYENQISYYERQVEFVTKEIEFLTRELNRERLEDRKAQEWTWSQGVLTKNEMKVFGGKFESTETHKILLERKRAYLQRKKYNRRIVQYSRDIADMMEEYDG